MKFIVRADFGKPDTPNCSTRDYRKASKLALRANSLRRIESGRA